MQRKFFVTVETESESVMDEVVEELKNAVAELNDADDASVRISDARRYHGKVKIWFDDKKYGFIIPDNHNKDLFVHLSGLDGLEALQPDQKVEYSLTRGKKGLQAVQVRTV